MNTLQWQLLQWGRRLGWKGLTGLALAALALGIYVTQVQPLMHTTQQLQQQRDELQAVAIPTEAVADPAASEPVATLPSESEAAWALGKLEQLAVAHGIELARGQYSVAAVSGTTLTRWQLVLPVLADYPALHAFVAAALERLPNLALDEIKLKRERIEDTDLQAELRLSLIVETKP